MILRNRKCLNNQLLFCSSSRANNIFNTIAAESTYSKEGGKKKQGFSGVLWKSTALVGTGIIGGLIWTYYDPELRKKIEKNIPQSKGMFDYMYERLGVGIQSEPLKIQKGDIQKKSINKEPQRITTGSGKIADEEKLKLTTVADLSPQPSANATSMSPKKANQIELKPIDVHEPAPKVEFRKEGPEAEREDEAYESKLISAIKLAGDNANAAKDSKFKTIKAIQTHSKALKQAVDSGLEQNESNDEWEKVKSAAQDMEKCSKQDAIDETSARIAIDALKEVISQGRAQKAKTPTIQNAIETVKKLESRLDELNYMIQRERSQTRVFSQYKELVQKGREQWADELKSAFPDINLRAKQGSLTEEELNAFIVHATMRIDELKRRLAEYQTQEDHKIANAIEEQRKIDEKLAKLHLDLELRRIRGNEDLELDEKIHKERQLWEAEVEAQLKRAAMAHAEHLEKVIRTQKQLHDIENAQIVQEAVTIERNKFAKQINSAVDRLNGIEDALNSRTAQDLENRRAKIFWTVCQNLLESLVNGDGTGGEMQYVTKLKEVKFIKDLTENDHFAQSICNCFPKKATESGVPTETGLKRRFGKVYKLARRVAQIDENGGGPFDYFLSWLQSLFMLKLDSTCSPDDAIDVEKYDPYELLARIKQFVGEDDFGNAIRLANLLRGESALIFRDWILDAQLHFEARFLAELLLSHAQVSSVRTTY